MTARPARPPGRERGSGPRPVTAENRRRTKTQPAKAEVMTSILAGGTGSGRICEAPRCGRPLPPGRRRFCSDLCRRRGQRAERRTEDPDYAAGVKRMAVAQGRRAAADLAMFVLFAESVEFARARLAEAAGQLVAQGYSYADIGGALGITRQAAWKRFGRKPEVDTRMPGVPGAAVR